MNFIEKVSLLNIVLFPVVLDETAFAREDASPLIDDDAGAIVVTARRVEERLQDVPISMTVFSQEQISKQNIVNAGDLARFTPSLTANARFGSENTSFAIRGFIQEGPTSPSVGVYFADVVAPRANGGTTGGNGAGPGSFFDLQNVQVLKGPQGTLFGRNTTGGAVLLVPQKPTGDLEGYVEGTIGNYDLRRAQAVLNVPLSDTFRVRLSVDRQKRDGYLRNVSGIGPRDFGDINYASYRLSVVGDLTPDLENYTIVSYSDSNTHGFLPKMFVVTNPAAYRAANYAAQIATTPGFYDVSNGNPGPHQTIQQWQVINTTTWQMSDTLTLKNIISYAEFRQRQTSNINGDNGFDPATNSHHYAIAIQAGDNGYNLSQSTFTEEIQIQGQSGDNRVTYQIGGYYERAQPLNGFQTYYAPVFANCTDVIALHCADTRGSLTPNGMGGTLEGRIAQVQISRSKYSFRNAGIYGQGTYNFTDQLSLTAGIRYTFDRTSGVGQGTRARFPIPNSPIFECAVPSPLTLGGTSDQVRGDASRCEIKRKTSSKRPTWLLGLDFKPSDDALLYAKYARGYRQGSINITQYGLETWGPESVDTYEIGAKTSFGGAVRGTFNIAAFYNDFRDQQLQLNLFACGSISDPQCPFIPATAVGIANAGSSTIKGVEVDASITPFDGFRIEANYAYLDTKIKSIELPDPPLGFALVTGPRAGGPIPHTPKNKFTITGSYTLPVSETVGQITLSATFIHQDSTLGSTSSLPAQQILPKQNLLNLSAMWEDVAGAPVDLSLFATNVTKNEFHTFTTGASNGFDSYIANQPRMYGARVRYRFGS